MYDFDLFLGYHTSQKRYAHELYGRLRATSHNQLKVFFDQAELTRIATRTRETLDSLHKSRQLAFIIPHLGARDDALIDLLASAKDHGKESSDYIAPVCVIVEHKFWKSRINRTLADLFSREAAARTLLIDAGFPVSRIPSFREPSEFWPEVTELADRGTLESGAVSIVARAIERYPHNNELLRISRLQHYTHIAGTIEPISTRSLPTPGVAALLIRTLKKSSGHETSGPIVSSVPSIEELQGQLQQAEARRKSLMTMERPPASKIDRVNETIRGIKQQLRRKSGGVSPGDSLGGQYELLSRLGRGGFAQVFNAWDNQRLRVVAAKVLHPHLTSDESRRRKFKRGANAMLRLDHPNIVRVFRGVEEDEGTGTYFFIMEHMVGGNLAQAIHDKRLDEKDIVTIILGLGNALAEAHRHGMFHQDIKPPNVLLDENNRAKLSDFDLVWVPDTYSAGDLPGGTFYFSAPETMVMPEPLGSPVDAVGTSHRKPDPTADIYSLAMTAVYALAGGHLNWDIIKHPDRFISRLPCNESMQRTLLKALDWDPARRHRTMREFCDAFDEASRHEDTKDSSKRHTIRMGDKNRPMRMILVRNNGTRYRPSDDIGAGDHEPPSSYWIADAPVTQGQWEWVMGRGTNPSDFYWRGTNRPVYNVSWAEAVEFLIRLSQKCGLTPCYSREGDTWLCHHDADGYRLPTDAEWDLAARAGTTYAYYFGNDSADLHDHAWFCDNAMGIRNVATKEPNPWGLYDIHGNVWEWVADQFESSENHRIIRGGSYRSDVATLKFPCRHRESARDRIDGIGFRCARSYHLEF